jgi:hypothetical protein
VRATASKLALLSACGYSFREDVPLPTRETSAEATRGTAFGSLAEARINRTPPPGQVTLPEEEARILEAMWGHADRWLKEHMRLGWRAEVAYAWDPSTDVGREFARTTHRDYSGATTTEVCGTADIVTIEDDSIVLYDWKTHAVGAPETDATAQLQALALFACRAHGFSEARIVTLRVTEHGVEPIEGEPITEFDLMGIAAQIATDLARVEGSEPIPGEHCKSRYCPARLICPATTALVAEVLPAAALAHKSWRYTDAIESPDHLAWILSMRPMVRERCEAVDEAISNYVKSGPVVCEDGSTVEATFRSMPRMSQKDLIELAKRKGATDDEISSCVHSALEGAGVKHKKAKALKRGRAA